MKRIGNLIYKIADINNLELAFYKAIKGKEAKLQVIEYRKNLQSNLINLQKQILLGEIQIGNYNYFTIYEPKERLICAAPFMERVLHHALMNVCHQYFENQLISDTYATRINKGTYKAVEKALYNNYRNKFYLKLDIRKYFDSISHKILNEKLQTIFKDPDLLYVFHQIIESYQSTIRPTATSGQTDKNIKGLPIGNLTSQYFANFYLAEFDRFVKQELQIKSYVRYMDDIIIWANTSQELNTILQKAEPFLTVKLELDLKIKYINTTVHGLNFLSYRIFDNHIELQCKSKKRFIKKMQLYETKLETDIFSQADYQRHVLPLTAFTEHASAKGFRKKVFGY